MICPLSFHHPPGDNSGGREQDFQTFGNAPPRVYQLRSQTQWPFCFTGLFQYQAGSCTDGQADSVRPVVPRTAFTTQSTMLLTTSHFKNRKDTKSKTNTETQSRLLLFNMAALSLMLPTAPSEAAAASSVIRKSHSITSGITLLARWFYVETRKPKVVFKSIMARGVKLIGPVSYWNAIPAFCEHTVKHLLDSFYILVLHKTD